MALLSKFQKNNILYLAKFLEKLPRNRFDYDSWVGDDWAGKPDLSCGTTACALGWAGTMPRFRQHGLKVSHSMGLQVDQTMKLFGTCSIFYPNEIVCLDDESNDNYCLETPDYTATAKQVAKFFRKYVKKVEKYERESK